jgi:hypothetical protein
MPRGEPPPRCHFCGTKNVIPVAIGIALGMGGSDYCFCEDCLKSNSAYKFWYNFFDTLGYEFPCDEREKAPD